MLNFGNKEFRNLQEQVLKNMNDIQDIEEGATVLANFGIKVVGQVATADELPDSATYEGDYGDAYLVGTETPYSYYIFTRAFEGQENPSWFNLGIFPQPGPQGQQGPQGEVGETPVIGATVGSTSTLQPGQAATASVTVSGTAAQPTMTFNFAIPQGAQGIQGPQGATGPQGPQGQKGDKGEKGEQGGLIEIVGIVASESDLPSPTTLQKLDAAYLVGSGTYYELYIQIGSTPSTALWTNVGPLNEGTLVLENGQPQEVWNADSKVSVTDGFANNRLYAQASGTGTGQVMVPYASTVTANNVVQRDANGQILVPQTPTADNQAASKKYVDDHASSSPIQYQGDIIVGGSQGEETRLPIGSAGQVLTVNSNGNGLEYTNVEGVPSYTNTDADKALKVNSTGTALEWATASGGGDCNVIPLTYNSNTLAYILKPKDGVSFSIVSSANESRRNSLFIWGTTNYTSHTIYTNSNASVNGGSPALWGSLYLGGTQNTFNATSTVMSSIDSIMNSKSNIAGQHSIIFSDTGRGYGRNSIIMGSFSVTNNKNCGLIDSILGGTDDINNADADVITTSKTSCALYRCLIFGPKHTIDLENNVGLYNLTMLGRYGTYSYTNNATDLLIVGGGGPTAPSNCFATGYSTTDGNYIKIGTTKITETQLQALLATL